MEIKKSTRKIAYLSMEIALESKIKTYAGGLGVLAGDTLRSAADLQVPMVGITLLSDQGYFKQKISKAGKQEELPAHYDFSKLKKLNTTVTIEINKDPVKIGVWEYIIEGVRGYKVPVYLLDAKCAGNTPLYCSLTGQLYREGSSYRLMQEMILGIAGIRMLEKLGYKDIRKVHMNEGHAAFAAIELFQKSKKKTKQEKQKEVKEKCVFTTHTPVEAGHDRFEKSLIKDYYPNFPFEIKELFEDNLLNMTQVGMYFSGYVNGVALKHSEVSVRMFPKYHIDAITNGVHSATWTSPDFQKLYDKYMPNWRNSSFYLRNSFRIPLEEIWEAHQKSKQKLLKHVEKKTGIKLPLDVFTIGFARRFTGYKRANLLLFDIKRLIRIHKNIGEIQILYAGKAHPSDNVGKKLIEDINKVSKQYKKEIRIIFLEGYDLILGKLLTSGVDIWLNTPLPPNEASGTSGMKAAHNAIPHFSTLDGWWIEGHIENKTGWAIGEKRKTLVVGELNREDANDLYNKLEKEILPRYYRDPEIWQRIMRNTIAFNASFFNTHRMLQHYIQEAYFYHED